MPNTYYVAQGLDGEQIEAALTAIDGVVSQENNGKVLAIENGKIVAKSASEYIDAPELISKTITENGTYDPDDDNVDGYSIVTVNVPSEITAENEGKVVHNTALVNQTSLSVTSNGTVDTTLNNSVTINVPNTYGTEDEGKVVSSGSLVLQTARAQSITDNGTYDTTENNSVTVSVPNTYSAADNGKVVDNGLLVSQTSKNVTQNGTFDTTTNNSVNVSVPNTYSTADEGKVVQSGSLSAQSALAITQNGTYDTTLKNSVTVDVAGGGGSAGDLAVSTTGETLRILPSKTSVRDGWGVISALLNDDIITSLEMPNLLTLQNESFPTSDSLVDVSLPVCTYIPDLSNKLPHMETLSAPLCQTIVNCSGTALQNANFPVCTYLGYLAFEYCISLSDAYFPNLSTIETNSGSAFSFSGCTSLETAEFNTALSFPSFMFESVLTPEKTFRLYLRGSTMGTCSEDVFGTLSALTRESESASVEGSGSGSGSGSGEGGGAIAGLEIYVPSALLNNFKTTWANGVFADNIFPLPDENENA